MKKKLIKGAREAPSPKGPEPKTPGLSYRNMFQCPRQKGLMKFIEDCLNKIFIREYPAIAEKWKIVLVPNYEVEEYRCTTDKHK